MKRIKPEEWIPSDGIVLEDNADIAVRCRKSILVVAGPGAGKTELLAQKSGYLFQTNLCQEPQKILAISFKKDAAENLKERIGKRYGISVKSRFTSMTYDAFSKMILDHFRLALPEELQPDEQYCVNNQETIEAAFKRAGYNNPYNLRRSDLNKVYEYTLANVTFPLKKDDLGEKVWKLLLKGFDGKQATLSFKMICILAEYIIRSNPKIKRALQYTYSYVFLDEFQDTTYAQYNLVKTCFQNSNTVITAVGDGKQRIMLWAGALRSVFSEFKKDFYSEETRLIMNHRSAPRLVMLQKQMYASLNEQDIKIQSSKKWKESDGKIKLLITDSEIDEAIKISDDIQSKIANGIKIDDICILCKQLPQNYTDFLIEELHKRGIRARIENEYQDLLKEPVIDLLIRFMFLSIDRKRPNDWEYVRSIVLDFSGAESMLQETAYYECQEKLSEKLNEIKKIMNRAANSNAIENIISKILNFIGVPNLKSRFPAYYQGTYFSDIIKKFKTFLIEELTGGLNNWMLALENLCGMHSIPIMTIHKSKGLEYSAVYFVGLEDDAFWNFSNQPEEERCAFFVALSRAKEYLMFTYCAYRSVLRNPVQHHICINEFFELLRNNSIVDVEECGKSNLKL